MGTNIHYNPSTAKLFYWNFRPREVVSRWRDPKLPSEYKLFRFDKMEVNDFEIWLIDVTFLSDHIVCVNKKWEITDLDRRLKVC